MRIIAAILVFLLSACQGAPAPAANPEPGPAPAGQAEAVFAGGCFWCTERDFEAVPGVSEVISGYTGGTLENPSYEDVITETTGHYESVLVRYDPKVITYAQLVERFWRLIDPTDDGGQFCDRGPSYRSAIFAGTLEQKLQAEASKAALQRSGKLRAPVTTEILPLGRFYPAETYHQGYAEKNPLRYKVYRNGCGRDQRLRQLWGASPAP